MVHRSHRLVVIGGLLLGAAASAISQTSDTAVMVEGDAQRSRVFATQSVDAPPTRVLWKAEKLFKITPTQHMSTQVVRS